MKLKRVENRIQIGIYRKESHTLKYSTYNSKRPRNEQLGILKNMLFRAYNLCDPGPDREQEIQTLRYAFINQDYPPKEVEQIISNYQECEGNEENKQAENRSESIVVPYIKGILEKLCRDLAKQDVNVVFMNTMGKILHSMILNEKFKKKDGRIKKCYLQNTLQRL